MNQARKGSYDFPQNPTATVGATENEDDEAPTDPNASIGGAAGDDGEEDDHFLSQHMLCDRTSVPGSVVRTCIYCRTFKIASKQKQTTRIKAHLVKCSAFKDEAIKRKIATTSRSKVVQKAAFMAGVLDEYEEEEEKEKKVTHPTPVAKSPRPAKMVKTSRASRGKSESFTPSRQTPSERYGSVVESMPSTLKELFNQSEAKVTELAGEKASLEQMIASLREENEYLLSNIRRMKAKLLLLGND